MLSWQKLFVGKGNMQFKDLTTFKIGGPIKHFFEVESDEEIIKAGKFAKENNLKIFILGGGSDILVSDKGLIAAIGLKNIVVVSTPEATLVFPKDKAQEVKRLVEALRQKRSLHKYL